MTNLRKSLWIILIVSILLRVLAILTINELGIVLGYTLLAFCIAMNKVFALAGSIISVELVRKNKPSCKSDKILCVLYIAYTVSCVSLL